MPESYPANSVIDALDGTSDSATGLEYIAQNVTPASSPTLAQRFNRLWQRLIKLITPANEGRVCQSDLGALKIYVYGLNYTLGGTAKSFSATDNTSVTNSATNYVYIDSSNALQVSTVSYPADITTFYRLARVTCAGGAITGITDDRGFNDHVVPQTTSSSDTGTDNTSFILDADNAGAGANQQVRFNRGSTDSEDAALEWDETNDRFNCRKQHSTATYCPINATEYFVSGTSALDSNGAAKVQSAVAGSGLAHSSGVLSVNTASASGTSISADTVCVDPSDGIAIDANGVCVSLSTYAGLQLTGSAGSKTLEVLPDDSTIEVDGTSGEVQLKDGGTNAIKTANNDGTNGSGVCVFFATLANGNSVYIHNAAAPFKFRIIDAWSVAKSADGGTWKLTDGTNDITNAVTVTGTDKTVNRCGTIDDAYRDIASSGSLRVVGDGALADVDVYVHAIRVA